MCLYKNVNRSATEAYLPTGPDCCTNRDTYREGHEPEHGSLPPIAPPSREPFLTHNCSHHTHAKDVMYQGRIHIVRESESSRSVGEDGISNRLKSLTLLETVIILQIRSLTMEQEPPRCSP